MSSTWFKSVRALKTIFTRRSGNFTNYILIAETAESNVINSNGGHDYHEWIMSSGDYDEIMRDVYKSAFYFDNGLNKWKPNAKDGCGFVRMCKKALDKAIESTTIPYNITGYLYWDNNKDFDYIIKLFSNIPNIKKISWYGNDTLITNDVQTYIKYNRRIHSIIKDYKEKVVTEPTTMKFEDWFENHKDWYMIEVE